MITLASDIFDKLVKDKQEVSSKEEVNLGIMTNVLQQFRKVVLSWGSDLLKNLELILQHISKPLETKQNSRKTKESHVYHKQPNKNN